MNRSIELMRLELEGRWSAQEMGEMMASLSDLYSVRFFLELLREDWREWEHFCEELFHFPPFRHRRKFLLPYWAIMPRPGLVGQSTLPLDERTIGRLSELVEPEERLEVRRIRYASPGMTDLAGVARWLATSRTLFSD